MCLTPISDIEIASVDITVYKIMFRFLDDIERPSINFQTGSYYSPFMGDKWQIGETKTVPGFSADNSDKEFREKLPDDPNPRIEQGFHAFTHKWARCPDFTAFKAAYDWAVGNVVVRCTIPAGTPFILGENQEIVSLALRLDEEICCRSKSVGTRLAELTGRWEEVNDNVQKNIRNNSFTEQAKRAALSLAEHLDQPYWLVGVGLENKSDHTVIIVLTTKDYFPQRLVPDRWDGLPVRTELTGSRIQPLSFI